MAVVLDQGFVAPAGRGPFTGGWRDFGFWFQDLIIGLAGSLPWLILLALVLTAEGSSFWHAGMGAGLTWAKPGGLWPPEQEKKEGNRPAEKSDTK